ncbi:MAG: hypothetical protein GY768_04270 [Planctomycetaceae bacterium]|nr:hypothetical protein [Planctomycetaceae bacterium]
MNWIFEQAAIPLFIGALLFAISAAIWTQTQSGRALIGCLMVIALTCSWLVVQKLVVTEPEQIRSTIDTIAEQVESNDIDSVMEHFSSSNPKLADDVRGLLQKVRIEKVSIKSNFQATVTRRNGLVSGEARFNAVATATDLGEKWGRQIVPRFVIVQLRKENGSWKIRSYQLQDPRQGIRQ